MTLYAKNLEPTDQMSPVRKLYLLSQAIGDATYGMHNREVAAAYTVFTHFLGRTSPVAGNSLWGVTYFGEDKKMTPLQAAIGVLVTEVATDVFNQAGGRSGLRNHLCSYGEASANEVDDMEKLALFHTTLSPTQREHLIKAENRDLVRSWLPDADMTDARISRAFVSRSLA